MGPVSALWRLGACRRDGHPVRRHRGRGRDGRRRHHHQARGGPGQGSRSMVAETGVQLDRQGDGTYSVPLVRADVPDIRVARVPAAENGEGRAALRPYRRRLTRQDCCGPWTSRYIPGVPARSSPPRSRAQPDRPHPPDYTLSLHDALPILHSFPRSEELGKECKIGRASCRERV